MLTINENVCFAKCLLLLIYGTTRCLSGFWVRNGVTFIKEGFMLLLISAHQRCCIRHNNVTKVLLERQARSNFWKERLTDFRKLCGNIRSRCYWNPRLTFFDSSEYVSASKSSFSVKTNTFPDVGEWHNVVAVSHSPYGMSADEWWERIIKIICFLWMYDSEYSNGGMCIVVTWKSNVLQVCCFIGVESALGQSGPKLDVTSV